MRFGLVRDQSHPAGKQLASRLHPVIVPAQARLSLASANLTGDVPKTRTRLSAPPGRSELVIDRRRLVGEMSPCTKRSFGRAWRTRSHADELTGAESLP
jgi:hypothetical protein